MLKIHKFFQSKCKVIKGFLREKVWFLRQCRLSICRNFAPVNVLLWVRFAPRAVPHNSVKFCIFLKWVWCKIAHSSVFLIRAYNSNVLCFPVRNSQQSFSCFNDKMPYTIYNLGNTTSYIQSANLTLWNLYGLIWSFDVNHRTLHSNSPYSFWIRSISRWK